MEYLIGAIVGFLVAGMVGRVKFLKVQNRLRATQDNLMEAYRKYITERDLFQGLSEEFDALVAKTRRVSL